MREGRSEYQLESLEPRLLLSASPLLPQALVAAPPIQVQVVLPNHQTELQNLEAQSVNPAYHPEDQVSDLFASATTISPAATAGSANAAATANTNEAPASTVNETADLTVQSTSANASSSGNVQVAPTPAQSNTTDTIVNSLNAAQPPPGTGILSYTAGPNGSNLTLKLDAQNSAQLDLIDNTTGAIVASSPLDQVNQVVVTGADNANDTLTVDMSSPFWLSGGVSFSGGASGYDTLAVTAPAGGSVHYTALGGGAGTADVTDGGHGTLISFTGLEPVDITASSYTFSPGMANAGSDVYLTLGTGTSLSGETVNQITGYFDGTAFESVNLVGPTSGTMDVTIDLSGAADGSSANFTGNDVVTIASSFVTPSLGSVTIKTGAGTNSVIVAAPSIAFPASGSGLTIVGGTGTTSLFVSGNYSNAAVNATNLTDGTLSLDSSPISYSNVASLQIPSTTHITPDLNAYLQNYISSLEAAAGTNTSIHGTQSLPVVSLGGMLELNGVQLTVAATESGSVWSGTVTISADSGTLFPGRSFSASITSSTTAAAVTGSYIIGGTYSLDLPSTATMTLTVGEALVINASGVSFSYDPGGSAGQTIATVANATVNSPQFTGFTGGTLTNFVIRADGFSFDGFSLAATAPSLNGIITADSAALTVSSFDASYGDGTNPASLSGTVGLTLSGVQLYPTGGLVQLSATSITPSYDFSSFDGTSAAGTGQLTIDINGFALGIGNALQVTAGDVVLTPGQAVMATIAAATITSPQFTGLGSIQVNNLVLGQNGFTIGNATWTSGGSVSIGSFIQADGVTLTLSNLGLQYGSTPVMTGGIAVSASGVVLFPTVPLLSLQLGNLAGSYNLSDSAHPAAYLALQIPNLDIPLGDALTVHLGTVDLNPGFANIVQVADATVSANLFSGLSSYDLGSFDLTPTGFTLGSFSISSSSAVTIGSFLSLASLSIDVSNFAIDISQPQPISGSITATLGTLTLFPGATFFTSSFTQLSGSYDLSSATSPGQFSFLAGGITLTIGDQFTVTANNVTLTPGASTLATIDNASLTFAPLDNLAISVNGLVVQPTGVYIDSATATLTSGITLGSILAIQNPTITLTNVDYVFGSGLAAGTVGFASSGASLSLGPALNTSAGNLSATYNLGNGQLSASLDSFGLTLAGLATFSSGPVDISYTPRTDGTAKMLLGASGMEAFLGTGTGSGRTGVDFASGTLALAIFKAADGTITYALDAQGSAGLLGMPAGSISINAGNLEFRSNTAGAVSETVTAGTSIVHLDFTGNEQTAYAANLHISVGTFASLNGDFGFSVATASGGQTYVAIAATNVMATVAAGDVSVVIAGASLGLLIAPGTSGAPATYALVAGGGTDSLNGVTGLTLTATGLSVRVRNGLDPSVVTGLPAQIATPGGSVSLDFSSLGSGTGNITDVEGTATLAVADFVSISGSFGFQQFSDGATTFLAVGASNLSIVLGTSATNLTLANASFGLIIAPGTGGAAATYALQATGSSNSADTSLNGVPNLNLNASNLLVRVRRGLDVTGNSSVPTSVQTPNGPVTLDFSGLGSGTTDVTDIEGHLTLSVAGLGSITGDFGFQTFTDGATGTTEWAIGATGTNIVVGTATTNFTILNATLALLVRPGDGVNPTTYALAATAASANLNGAGVLTVSASNLLVRIRQGLDLSTASGLPASVQTSGGAAAFDFSGLPAGSSNLVDVEGTVTLSVGSFVTLGGNFGIQSYTDGVDHYLEFGGTGITATLTAGSVNLTIANATLGVVVKQGTTAGYAVVAKGSSNPADTSLNGVPGLTLNASNLLVRARNGLDVSALPATVPGTIHTSGGDVTLDFSGLGSGTSAVTDIQGHLTLAIGGFASLAGDFGFQKFTDGSGSDLAIAAANVTTVLGTPTVNVTVAGASLALLVKPGIGYALIANGGTDSLNGVPGLSLSASGLRVISRQGLDPSTVSGMPASVQVPGGSVNFDFTGLGTTDVTTIAGHISLNIANFVSLAGDFSFTQTTSGTLTKILVGATGVDAFVGSADQSFGVQISGASLGLVIYRDTTKTGSTYALETSAPNITINGLPSEITLSGGISVAVNTTGAAVNETIAASGQTITFTDGTSGSADQRNIRSIGGSLTLGVGSIFTVTGDFSFTKLVSGTTTTLLIGAANVATGTGTSVAADGGGGSFTLSKGTLGLVVFGDGTYALKASGTATATVGGGALSASATLTIRINATTSQQNQTVTVGTTTVAVVFSSSEVATVSGSTTTVFKQITVGDATLNIDNTLIITAGQATSTTPVAGAESIPLTSVTLTIQNPSNSYVLFSIGADSAEYITFSGTVTASVASAAGLPVRADGGSWVSGDKALVLSNVAFSIGSVVTFTANQIDVQHFTSGSVTTNSFGFSGAVITFYAGSRPMVSLKGSPSFHYSTADGFKLDSFTSPGFGFLGEPDPPATAPLGPVTLIGPSVSVGNFDFGFGSGTTANLSATITISAATATIGASTSPVHAGMTGVSGSFDVTVGFDLANLSAAPTVSANGFTLSAQTFTVVLGSYLTLSAGQPGGTQPGILFDPTAGATQDLVAFSSLTATLNIGAVSISGTAYNFAIEGDGSFLAKSGFGVSISLGQNGNGDASSAFDWPSWFPLQSASITLVWSNFNTDPSNFVIELSAAVSLNSLKGIPLTVSGSVTDMVIDPSLVGSGRFPIVSIDSATLTVQGDLFGGTVDGTLIVGVVRFDASGALVDGLGNLVGTTTPGTGAITNVFYGGIEAGFSLGGMAGFNIRVGLSEYGPLQVYVEAGVAIPLGNTGLFLSNFRGGVEFNAQFPAITISNPAQASDALQLRQPGFSTPDSLTTAQWEAQLRSQVVTQFRNGVDGWSNLGSASMIIQAGATIYEGTPQVFRVDADVLFDTSGKFLVIGSATFGNSLSVGVKMYADLGPLFSAPAGSQNGVALNILFLMEVPSQNTANPISPPIYSLYGVTTFSYINNVFQISIAGAADLNVLGGLQAHVEATLTLAFGSNSFTVTLSGGSFSIPQIQSDPLGTAAGTLTIQALNGNINVWGGFLLIPNLHGLDSLGIEVSGQVFIKLNTTNVAKQVTLSNGTLNLKPASFELFVNGAANFKVGGEQLFQLNGTLSFEIASTSLTLFVQAQLLMGPDPQNPILTFNANGLIFVQVTGTAQIHAGFAAKMMLSMGGSVPGITFNENWLLVMNTTGVDVTYFIPAPVGNGTPVPTVKGPDYSSTNPLALVSYETTVNGHRALVIPSGPPAAGLASYANWTSPLPNTPYLVILGRGSLTVAGSFVLTGNINIVAAFGSSGFVFSLDANATLALQISGNTVFSFVAVGGVQLSNSGIVAAFSLSMSSGFSIPSSLGFSMSGTYLLELNTTGVATTVNGILVSAGTNGLYANIHAVGELKFVGGVVDLHGTFDITATGSSLTVGVDANITFLNATFTASGFAGIYYDAHPGVALRIALSLPGGAQGFAPISALGNSFVISGAFTLAVNTSSITRYDQNNVAIASGAVVKVSNLGVYMFGFNLTGSLSIGITSAGFAIDVAYLHLDFFGLASVTLTGYYHPDGNFRFTGSAGFQIGNHTVGLGGTVSVTISNSGFAASVSGWAAFLGVEAGASGSVVINNGSVDITVSIYVVVVPAVHIHTPAVKVAGVTIIPAVNIDTDAVVVSGSHTFHLGDTSPPPYVPQPPALAGVDNGVLVLFIGSDVNRRVDSGGTETGAQAAENYSLTLGSNANTILVSALGYTQTYTGVYSILVNNTLSGNDTITISYSINLPVNITLGSGNNTINTGSGAATVHIAGGGANNVTTGDSAHITIAGNGVNTVSTGSGSTMVISGDGSNNVTTNGGSAPFTISGDGNNTAYVNHGGTFTFTVSGTGANTITIVGGSPTVNVASTASGANRILISTSAASSVAIAGNGNNSVTVAGTGAPTITVTGNGGNQITTGAGTATVTLRGTGTNSVTTGSGFATVYDQGAGSTIVHGGSGGGVLIGGVTSGGVAFTTKGVSSLTTVFGNFSVRMSGYASYVLSDAALNYGAFSLQLSGVKEVTLTAIAGQAAHTFTLNGWTGAATLNGAGGDNTVISMPAAGVSNLTYILSDALLQVAGSVNQAILLSGIQTADLTGGTSINSFDVSGWTGDGRLSGPGGSSNSLIAAGDVAVYSLADTFLARTGHGTMALDRIQRATLTGGAGSNVFDVSSWSGIASLNGAGANDTYNLTLYGTTGARFTVADTGASSGDMLNISGPQNFTVTASQVRDGTELVAYSGIEVLNLSGAVDGLTYYVQSTASGVTTSIETAGPGSFIDVGSTAGLVPSVPGVLSTIQGTLSVSGGGTMLVDNTGSGSAQTGTLTPTSLTGFAMGSGGIQYQDLSLLTVNLGAGGNTLTIQDINSATHTVVDGGRSAGDRVNASFAGNFDGRLDLTGFEHGSVVVTDNFRGTLNDSAPGHLESVQIGDALTATGFLSAGSIDTMSVGGDLAGIVTVTGDLGSLSVGGSLGGIVAVQNTLGSLDVAGDVSGTVTESGTIDSLTIGGSLTSTGSITASNTSDPAEVPAIPQTTFANIDTMSVGGDLAGLVSVTGNLGSLSVGGSLSGTVSVQNTLGSLDVAGDVSGTVSESGTINSVTIGGSLTSTGSIIASNTSDPSALPPVDPPFLGNITTMNVGGDLAGHVTVTGDLGSLSVGANLSGTVLVNNTLGDLAVTGDLSGTVTESGTINSITIGGSLTSTGAISAVNVTPSLGNINSLTIGRDFAGSVTVSGTLHELIIVNGSMTPTATLTVGNLDSLAIGPDHLSVGQNLAGVITVSGTLGSLRVAGGTPGTIIAGHIGTIAVYGGFGPVVLNVTENGIQRLVEAASPDQPYPLPDPAAVALAPGQTGYVNFQFYYESGSLMNPQLTVRVANGKGTAPDQYDLSLITYNDAARFNLARLDASGIAGVRNVVVEGDLLTAVSAQAAAFFMVPGPGGSMVQDATPAGVRLPADHLAGVSIRDFAPDGYIQAASIQAVAFGSFSEHGRILTGAQANAHDAEELLARCTRIVQAADTFRVAFADLPTQHVALFFATEERGGHFNNDSIMFEVQSVVTANAEGTANITTQSNVARGAATALVTVMPVPGCHGRLEDSVVNTIAINGDGASIETRQWISQGITSGGPLGDLILSSNRGITNVTAPSIFGSISSTGPLTGIIQTTGLRTDPITGEVTSVPATIGRLYVVLACGHDHDSGWFHGWHGSWKDQPQVVATTISIGGGGIRGSIVSRGDLISTIVSHGGISGVVAVQGNLGVSWMSQGSMQRFGGIVSDGPLSGSVIVLGEQIGDVTIHGGLKGGDYAVAGDILGNLTIDGGLSCGSTLVSGGAIGSASLGTALKVNGENRGIIAALGPITFAKRAPRGWVFDNAGADPSGADATAISAIFTDGSLPLSLDINPLDLGGLALIQTNLDNLYVNCQGSLASRPGGATAPTGCHCGADRGHAGHGDAHKF